MTDTAVFMHSEPDTTTLDSTMIGIPDASWCYWYHRMEIPGIGLVGVAPEDGGECWDFRAPGRADEYLGAVSFADKRVLEVGPASGFWTVELERRGAEVLCLEIDRQYEWDFVPNAAVDLAGLRADRAVIMDRLRASWHVVKASYGLRAQIIYGHAEQPPSDRGSFDAAMLGCVLLHTRHPLTILERVAAMTTETIIIVERYFPELGDAPVCRLASSTRNRDWGTWWDFSPAFLVQALQLLGFAQVDVSYHRQQFRDVLLPMFTVVARRSWAVTLPVVPLPNGQPGHAPGASRPDSP